MDGLGIEVTHEELTFQLVQVCNAATGYPLTDDELRLIPRIPNSWRCSTRDSSPPEQRLYGGQRICTYPPYGKLAHGDANG